MDKMPLFIFPIGGRGDFLISILYGNILSKNWNQATVTCPMDDHSGIAKIHFFGSSHMAPITVQPDNLHQFLSFKIGIDTKQDLLEVSYFNALKQNDGNHISPKLLKSRITITQSYINQFADYNYDYVIPFSKLKDISYIHELYTKINNRVLTQEELTRIQCNIDINQAILANMRSNVANVIG